MIDVFRIDINGARLAGSAPARRGRVVPHRVMAWTGRRANVKLAAWIAAGSLLAAGSGYLVSTALPGGTGTDPDSDR